MIHGIHIKGIQTVLTVYTLKVLTALRSRNISLVNCMDRRCISFTATMEPCFSRENLTITVPHFPSLKTCALEQICIRPLSLKITICIIKINSSAKILMCAFYTNYGENALNFIFYILIVFHFPTHL